MSDNNVFGTRLREKRKEKKLTQKQLAELIGAKHNSVSDWERGDNKPDPDTIERICEVLDISASYLLPSNRKNSPANDSSENSIIALTTDELNLLIAIRSLDAPGKAAVQAVLESQQQRIKEYGPADKKPTVRRIPLMQGTEESVIQMQYQARQEQRELEQSETLRSDPT